MNAIFTAELSSIKLIGDGLNIFGEGASFSLSGGPGFVGTTANFDARFDFFPISGPITETVNGISYRTVLDGNLTFTTEPFLVQPPPAGTTIVTFSAPFSMTGTILGYAPTGPFSRDYGDLLFSVDVFGTGVATQTKLFNASTNFYSSPQNTIFYTFQDAAATPEPASMLLLGTGVAGLFARQRRKSRA